uniref:putative UPF0481 protein At3g02645 n=1 Tax=Erigeron canadensis TaxID=72917 RepID=UPI001CB92942|nr:putative UPF0481 protein At3g02645 [Erigeron canadensis]
MVLHLAPQIINIIGKEVSITKANEDLEYGSVPDSEEELLQFVNNETKCVDICPHEPIGMVPSVLRKLSKKSFIPRVVSVGPIHRDNKNLHEFERKKASYLRDLLSRSCIQRPEDQLKECREKVKAKLEIIRSSYDDVIMEKYKDKDDQLANMMVLDGSFILEFCLKRDNKEETLLSKIQITWIAIDLMLLENQIPFIVLQIIFNYTINNKPHPKNYLTCLLRRILGTYVHPFSIPDKEVTDGIWFSKCFPKWFSKMVGSNKKKPNDDPIDKLFPDNSKDSEHAHVLACLHKIYKVKPSKMDGQPSQMDRDVQASLNYNHSVVELDRSGVNFTPQKQKEESISMNIKKSRSCFHLSPWTRLTLFMPTLVIQEFTEAVLRNFIAYEQFSPEVDYYFTSYASVMDMLIDSKADVGKLVESKVIVNNLGSNKDVARVINGICVNIEIERFCHSEVIQKLDKYYESYWPKHFAYLKRTYFGNPWTVIAFFAGFIVFGLTVLQAVLRIMDR